MQNRYPLCAAMALIALGAGQALAFEGRTLGSFLHNEGPTDEDLFRLLYDMGDQRPLTQDVGLHTRMSLQYYNRIDVSGQELWRSRFHANLMAPTWRVEGQFAPWQRTVPGFSSSRSRDGLVGAHWTPRRGPRLDVQYQRFDREALGVQSHSDDRRVRVGYAARGLTGDIGYRQIDTGGSTGIAAASRTQEWRGTLQGVRGLRRGSLQSDYEALWSRFGVRDRRRDLMSQRLGAGGAYSPLRRVTVGASAARRWGAIDDNALIVSTRIDETTFGAQIEVLPVDALRLQAARQYSRLQARPRDNISDYLQLQADYRRAVVPGTDFHVGWLRVANFAAGGDAPNDGAYVLVDGHMRRGIGGRAEMRAARQPSIGTSGIRWHRLLELRTHPSETTRFDVQWRRESQPEILGLDQQDREWSLTSGWDPVPGSNLVLVWRAVDSWGRVSRGERLWTFTGTMNPSERAQLALQWSRRDVVWPFTATVSEVLSADGSYGLPTTWQAHALYRQSLEGVVFETRSYGFSLEKRF